MNSNLDDKSRLYLELICMLLEVRGRSTSLQSIMDNSHLFKFIELSEGYEQHCNEYLSGVLGVSVDRNQRTFSASAVERHQHISELAVTQLIADAAQIISGIRHLGITFGAEFVSGTVSHQGEVASLTFEQSKYEPHQSQICEELTRMGLSSDNIEFIYSELNPTIAFTSAPISLRVAIVQLPLM